VCGDKRAEVVIYDPYGDAARQYNARLLNWESMPDGKKNPWPDQAVPCPRARYRRGGSILSPYRRRLGWAALLARVFAVDVTLCPRRGGRRPE